ncbi:thioredoxin family protein [Phaeocystidibacter luteus]|uniref:Thioredoxin family protein n=1 Tax=Phaeocystidibacter luteus TaxID=911197 RepID=A0A6N6RKV4_9FLAO|nr:thioredoxin family protein [Phaeocystidibacter luteus]KAB2809868.1 thioredoxin family protein [Phaeocystidibacter luteus]
MEIERLVEAFKSGQTYDEYRAMLDELLADGKTTGPDQSESMINYASLNNKRMDRGDKTVKVDDSTREVLGSISGENWLVLTEGWCGDASQILPTLSKLENASDNIEMRLILRDENPDIMDAFLTNGTRSIPKIIRLNEDFTEVLGSWGPRPAAMQALVDEWKKTPEVPKSEMYTKVHGAYAKDRGKQTIAEIVNFLEQTHIQTV